MAVDLPPDIWLQLVKPAFGLRWNDIKNLCLVSHNFRYTLQPILFRTLNIRYESIRASSVSHIEEIDQFLSSRDDVTDHVQQLTLSLRTKKKAQEEPLEVTHVMQRIILRLKRLKSLRCINIRITKDMLDFIFEAPSLEELRLTGVTLDAFEIPSPPKLGRLNLRTLAIYGQLVLPSNPAERLIVISLVACLVSCSSLRSLKLLLEEPIVGIIVSAGLPNYQTLTSLTLREPSTPESAGNLINFAAQCPNLKTLRCEPSNATIGGPDFPPIPDHAFHHLAKVWAPPKLARILIPSRPIDEAVINHDASYARPLTDPWLTWIIPSAPTLRILSLCGIEWTDYTLRIVANHLPQLEVLTFTIGTGMYWNWLKGDWLAPLTQFPNLRILQVWMEATLFPPDDGMHSILDGLIDASLNGHSSLPASLKEVHIHPCTSRIRGVHGQWSPKGNSQTSA